MQRIYISSTYEDLAKEREAVYHTLRKFGLDVIAMEDYVASDSRPIEKCLNDLKSCDVYIGIIAWRYGFIPHEENKSITELEYRTALEFEKTCLLFLLDENAPWPRIKMDKDLSEIEKFRTDLQNNKTISFFLDSSDLCAKISTAMLGLLKFDPQINNSFNDERVARVANLIKRQLENTGDEYLSLDKLIPAVDMLFSRKTFRNESLRNCPEQRWADRLHSAYQTYRLLQLYEENVQMKSSSNYRLYAELIKEVGGYCMDMGSLLFEPAVDYNKIEKHIGKNSFKEMLPAEKRFPVGNSNLPIIPDDINNPIEKHRLQAIENMDQLMNVFQGSRSTTET